MANSPTETRWFTGFDGARLAWRELGSGRPVVLIHGYMSDARTNWIRYGHAEALASKGFRVILPDLRGHGDSDKPHDPAAYPPDALTRDGHALVEQLGLTDYDLGGYSLGARTVSRMLATGAVPRRVILSGMGLEGLTAADRRSAYFRNVFDNLGNHARGSSEWMAEGFLRTTGGDAVALRLVIDTFASTPEQVLRDLDRPTLVLAGADDGDNGSFRDLAAVLPQGELVEVPGNHMSAVTKPELGRAMADFLAA